MSLALGSGPLSRHSTAAWNLALPDQPAHRIVFQPDPRRIRALVGDTVVLDTVRAHLLHETGILPVVYAPLEDFADGVWIDSDTRTHCPFKGDAAYRHLRAGATSVDDLLWLYADPQPAATWLRGFGALYAHKVDAWFVEDDRVVGHLRDPYHRVDAHQSSRRVVVRAGGRVVADSSRPVLVFETGLPLRAYVPPADVRPGAVARGSGKRTICPYKGEATYWSVLEREDAAWSFETPLPDALRAQAHFCFDESVDGIEVELS
jgi:uncharacterized protein (DUF427 family)